jgi:hypothetical protein
MRVMRDRKVKTEGAKPFLIFFAPASKTSANYGLREI